MESAFDVGIRVNQTRIGITASVPARHRWRLTTYAVCCPKAANGFGGLALCRAGTKGILILGAYGSRLSGYREKGKMESVSAVGIRVNNTRIGITASVPARHR